MLGPTEALVEMAAFIVTFWAVGWRPGRRSPPGRAADRVGAAFAAVVLGQVANAFACRSAVAPPVAARRDRNRLLIGAVAAMLVLLVGFLFIPPIADLLGQAPPSAAGFAVALLAVPAVLGVDTLDKAVQRRRRQQV